MSFFSQSDIEDVLISDFSNTDFASKDLPQNPGVVTTQQAQAEQQEDAIQVTSDAQNETQQSSASDSSSSAKNSNQEEGSNKGKKIKLNVTRHNFSRPTMVNVPQKQKEEPSAVKLTINLQRQLNQFRNPLDQPTDSPLSEDTDRTSSTRPSSAVPSVQETKKRRRKESDDEFEFVDDAESDHDEFEDMESPVARARTTFGRKRQDEADDEEEDDGFVVDDDEVEYVDKEEDIERMEKEERARRKRKAVKKDEKDYSYAFEDDSERPDFLEEEDDDDDVFEVESDDIQQKKKKKAQKSKHKKRRLVRKDEYPTSSEVVPVIEIERPRRAPNAIRAQALHTLRTMFPSYTDTELVEVLNSCNDNVEQAAALISEQFDEWKKAEDEEEEELRRRKLEKKKRAEERGVKRLKRKGDDSDEEYAGPGANRRRYEDSDEEEAMSEDDDDDDSGSDFEDREDVDTLKETIKHFNDATVQQLMDGCLCTQEQAELIIKGRPYRNQGEILSYLSKTKGVSAKLIEVFKSQMSGYRAVDNLIHNVAKVGTKVLRIVKQWQGKGDQTDTASASEDIDEEKMEESGLHLVADENTMKVENIELENELGLLQRQPSCVAEGITLKSYQLLGISWLCLLWRQELSGILADEMGLGKTAQVISFLGYLKMQGETGPHVVVVPASTLDNWVREFNKFCPYLIVRTYYGSQNERRDQRYELLDTVDEYDVLITTYNLATGAKDDRKLLKKIKPKILILDEGHMVKNAQAARHKYLMEIPAKFRLLLTGTPLQNNLRELMALLSFILPRLFSEDVEEAIREIFSGKAGTKQDTSNLFSKQRILRAKKIMQPFVLRRRKIEVLRELPKKSELIEWCEPSRSQGARYRDLMAESGLRYHASADGEQRGEKKQLSNYLMQMRKMADHPLLFRFLYDESKLAEMAKKALRESDFKGQMTYQQVLDDFRVRSDFELHQLCNYYKSLHPYALTSDSWMDAGKVQKLVSLLAEMKQRGDRVLVFSQFTKMLDILEAVMATVGYQYLRLDGSTAVQERQSLIDKFNEKEDNFVFLLSTRAGGFGINLATANVVILYDIDFNPHNDAQAEDRAHRVGQTRDVTVIKLLMRGTIEEQILKLAQTKLKLDKSLAEAPDTGVDEEVPDEGDEAKLVDMIREQWVADENSRKK